MDASDQEFQAFVNLHDLHIEDGEEGVWSFDDRCRLINHGRKYGVDLFTLPNTNSSESAFKQFGINSETIPNAELFEVAKEAPQATLDAIGMSTVPELRDDIDSLLQEIAKSSEREQNEFEVGE